MQLHIASALVVSSVILGCSASGGELGGASGGGGTAASGNSSSTGGGANTGGSANHGGATGTGGTGAHPVVVGYLLDFQSGGLTDLGAVDYSAADVVVHAFVDPGADGSLTPLDPFDQYRTAGLPDRVHAVSSKILFSVGGSNHSARFKDSIGPNPAVRTAFATNVVQKIAQWGYDGVDIDYEFPSDSTEEANHLALLQEVHAKVKAANPSHVVIFGASPGYWLAHYDWPHLGSACDYAFYFCYDWNMPALGPITNPGQTLRLDGGDVIEASCRGAIDYIVGHGFPAKQLVVGLPFYSSAGTAWYQVRAQWSAGAPWPVDPNYMESQIGGAWWTPPEALRMKVTAVLDPTKSVLSNHAVAGGVGFWQWGHESPSNPDLSKTLKDVVR